MPNLLKGTSTPSPLEVDTRVCCKAVYCVRAPCTVHVYACVPKSIKIKIMIFFHKKNITHSMYIYSLSLSLICASYSYSATTSCELGIRAAPRSILPIDVTANCLRSAGSGVRRISWWWWWWRARCKSRSKSKREEEGSGRPIQQQGQSGTAGSREAEAPLAGSRGTLAPRPHRAQATTLSHASPTYG